MLVFIDESGDAGFKITKGSSPHFVIALVIFEDELAAEETALIIKKLKRELKKSNNFEFKFNKNSKDIRLKFLNSISGCQFIVRTIIFDKNKIYSPTLRTSKEKFYNYALKTILEHNNGSIKNGKIRLDGQGDKTYKKELTNYLRKSLNSESSKVMNQLRFRDSKKDVLIQLADMIAGTIKRKYSDKTDRLEYFSIIKRKIVDEWEFK